MCPAVDFESQAAKSHEVDQRQEDDSYTVDTLASGVFHSNSLKADGTDTGIAAVVGTADSRQPNSSDTQMGKEEAQSAWRLKHLGYRSHEY